MMIMAMSLSSCTSLLMTSRAPPRPTPTLRKSSSGGAGSLQLRSRQPAPAPAAASSRSRRAAVFACHAGNKYSYHHIDANALVYPPTTAKQAGTNWTISEDKDKSLIILELEVGDLTKDKLEVSTTDHALLVVKYKGDINDDCRASSLDVRLLMPPGYDEKNVGAVMQSNGWLKITIPKPDHKPKNIEVSTP